VRNVHHMLLRTTADGRGRRAACGRRNAPSGILCEAPPATDPSMIHSDGVTCKACLKVLGPRLVTDRKDDTISDLRDQIDRLVESLRTIRAMLVYRDDVTAAIGEAERAITTAGKVTP
jgi:hypothetical protein